MRTGGRILALDYGRTKIGMALADADARIAEPYDTMERINRNEDMRRLRELARDENVKQIVVGLPLRLDGTLGEMAEEVTGFAERVRKQVGVPVELVDERLTQLGSGANIGRGIRSTNQSSCNNARPKEIDQTGRWKIQR